MRHESFQGHGKKRDVAIPAQVRPRKTHHSSVSYRNSNHLEITTVQLSSTNDSELLDFLRDRQFTLTSERQGGVIFVSGKVVVESSDVRIVLRRAMEQIRKPVRCEHLHDQIPGSEA